MRVCFSVMSRGELGSYFTALHYSALVMFFHYPQLPKLPTTQDTRCSEASIPRKSFGTATGQEQERHGVDYRSRCAFQTSQCYDGYYGDSVSKSDTRRLATMEASDSRTLQECASLDDCPGNERRTSVCHVSIRLGPADPAISFQSTKADTQAERRCSATAFAYGA
jgi:hypothetical protein